MSAGTFGVTQGTTSGIPIDTIGGTVYPISKIDIGAIGATFPWQGQVTATGNTGTGVVLASNPLAVGGTDTGGTFRVLGVGANGQVLADTTSQLPPGIWGTSINTAGTAFGTLHAAVGGSVVYVTDLEINMAVVPGTLALYNGANTNLLAGSWAFNSNGGMVTNRRTPIQGLSGSALCYQQTGTASLSITASGFIK